MKKEKLKLKNRLIGCMIFIIFISIAGYFFSKEIITGILAVFITAIIVMIVAIAGTYQGNKLLSFCKSKGYDGHTVDGFNKYRCYKKVPTNLGYEYEYSGIIDEMV